MAIFGATVSATVINITGTGGTEKTFDECVVLVNFITPGTITGTGTSIDPYVITTPSGYRTFRDTSGCIIRVVANTYITWGNITTSGQYAWMNYSGAIQYIDDGVYFNQSAGTAGIQVYNYWNGASFITGTSGSHVTIKGCSRNYIYCYEASTWTYFDIIDMRISGAYGIYIAQAGINYNATVSLTNFTITAPTTGFGYGILFSGSMSSNITISDFVIDGIEIGVYFSGASGKVKNGEIKNCTNMGVYGVSVWSIVRQPYETSKDDTLFPAGVFQSMGVVENVAFTDNYTDSATKYHVLNYYGSTLLLKDCTFNAITYSGLMRSIYTRFGSRTLEYNNTYTNLALINKFWGENGTFLHCRKFDILVQDGDGVPIKDATVSWVQGSATAKEIWTGTTDTNGQLLSIFSISPMLVEKEETSSGVYQQWSNSTATGLCHNLLVSKVGYQEYQNTYEMTADKSIVVTLYPYIGSPTTIKNVTITGNVTIY